jgi:uridine kinase
MANLSDKIRVSIDDLEDMLGVFGLPDFIGKAESRFVRQTAEVADDVIAHPDIKVVFVSGPTSSGKTTFTDRLVSQLEKRGRSAIRLSLDDYYSLNALSYDEEGRPDFESVETLDMRLASMDLARLVSGDAVVTPTFDFKIRQRVESDKPALSIGKNGVVVVEGLHGLCEETTGSFSKDQYLGIFIMPYASVMSDRRLLDSDDLRMLRRIVRDVRHRGAHALTTIDYWPMIQNSEQAYYRDYLTKADYHINSFLAYEPLVIAALAKNDIEEALSAYEQNRLAPSVFMEKSNLKKDFANLEKAVAKARMLESWLSLIPQAKEKFVPKTSILNEFLCL